MFPRNLYPRSISDLEGPILVFRLGRINLVNPIQDAGLEVQDPLNSNRTKEIRRLGASPADLAQEHDLVLRIQFDVALGNVTERDEHGASDAIDLVLVGLADIHDLERIA